MASGVSAMVGNLPHNSKVMGSSPAPEMVAGTCKKRQNFEIKEKQL
jgi:hypothetical protein